MKQLLIAKNLDLNAKVSGGDNVIASNSNKVARLDQLDKGALCLFRLSDNTDLSTLNDGAQTPSILKAADKFAIALGRSVSTSDLKHPFIISEVDPNTMSVTKTLPYAGVKRRAVFTFPTPEIGKEYTVAFYKKGTVPHERNTWHVSIVAKTTTAATEGTALVEAINNMANNDNFAFSASISTAQITITATDNTDWEIKLMDELASVSVTDTAYKKAIGDKAYIQDLASQCAAGKGYSDTYADGISNIPGYPEDVETFTLNTSGSGTPASSTTGYILYTIRFNVGRDASKTRDEVVNQLVHIAIPVGASAVAKLDKIFGL